MLNSIDRSQKLDHERLDAYTAAVALDGAVVAIARKAGRGHGWLCDQATRASASVVLNLAEALGREGLDRARALLCIAHRTTACSRSLRSRIWSLFIARCSALELDAALSLVVHRGARRVEHRNGRRASRCVWSRC
jgi:hypothetical protein